MSHNSEFNTRCTYSGVLYSVLVGGGSTRVVALFGSVTKLPDIADYETNAMALTTEPPFCEW